MKTSYYSFIPLLFILPYVMGDDDDQHEQEIVATGIFLDTLNNEVQLMMQEGQPKYYFANVFTPVCNTGECLPVKVNFYWDLTGKYLRFDQPEGEILTKADHEPFTKEDYALLDDILLGSDPRMGGMNYHGDSGGVKHNKGDQQESQAQPAPGSIMKLSKYEMVDGITGSTLPEIKDQFVPGALYTTYTLWGLANDHQQKMRDYSIKHLMEVTHLSYLAKQNKSQYNEMIIAHLTQDKVGKTSRRNVLISLLDTGNIDFQMMTLNSFYYNDYLTEEVQLALHNKFYNSSELKVRKRILYRWSFNHIQKGSMIQLSVNVHNNQDIMDEIVALYHNKQHWPENVFDNLVQEMEKIDPENQVKLLNLFKSHKDYLSSDQWKVVQKLEKKY